MINDIINKMGKSINEEFGEDYTIYSENMPQDFNTPCFFIECIKYSREKALSRGTRFLVSTVFRVTYFSYEENLNQNEDIYEISDRVFDSIEYIDGYSGDGIKAEFSDGILAVTVNYDFQAVKENEKNYMNNLKQKGGVR